MTDKNLNEQVARRLGWKDPSQPRCGGPREGHAHGDFYACYEKCPDYCNSIGAAWEIVKFLRNKSMMVSMNLLEHCDLKITQYDLSNVLADAWENSTPRALCLAFLRLPEDK